MSIHVSTLRKFIKEEVSRISRQKRKSWLYEGALTAALAKKAASTAGAPLRQKCYKAWDALLIEHDKVFKEIIKNNENGAKNAALEKEEHILAEDFLALIATDENFKETTEAEIFAAFGVETADEFIKVELTKYKTRDYASLTGAFMESYKEFAKESKAAADLAAAEQRAERIARFAQAERDAAAQAAQADRGGPQREYDPYGRER